MEGITAVLQVILTYIIMPQRFKENMVTQKPKTAFFNY
jgi:hypothetical protein